MSVAKFVIPVVLLAAVYFILFASDMPGEIEYRGQTLGPREQIENNSVKEFDIYSYSDKTRHHVMLFVMATTADSPSPQELLEFYVKNFGLQGFRFMHKEGRYLGTKGDEVIYMTRAPRIDSAIAYIEKSEEAPTSLRGASDIFSDLEDYAFE